MSKVDYYQTLGVEKNADEVKIKKAYKRLAMKHHPDRNIGNKASSEEKFKVVKEAYEVLSDSQKRQAYDQFGHDGLNQNSSGFGGGFEDIFSDFFGSSNQGRQQNNRGNDLQYNLEINLKEAIEGTTVKIRIPKNQRCDTCHGNGAKPGTKIDTCSTCGGHGQVQMQQGFFSVQRTCPTCQGKGKKIRNPCGTCGGKGLIQKDKSLSVKVPAGVNDGNRIRLQGEGEASISGLSGDLYVQIQVKPHHIFQRHDNDLYCEIPILFATAALGGSIEVPTINSKVKIKIPSGSQTGKIFKIRSKGVPSLRGGASGDLLCQIKIETPVNLTSKQKQLLEEFSQTCQGSKKEHYPETNSFFDKVKSFFE